MNAQSLYDAVTLIDDDLIDEAAEYTPKKAARVVHWKRWTALAACCAVVVGAGSLIVPHLGGSAGNSGSAAMSGAEEGTEFMSYAGPVFPLTTLGSADALTAQRELTLDFAPWEPVWYSNEAHAAETVGADSADYQEALEQYYEWWSEGGYYRTSTDLLVTDACALTNTTDEDRTFTALYPFVSSLNDLSTTLPTLTADGEVLDAELIFGPYSGGFQGAEGLGSEGDLNLKELTSWTAYRALLEDGSYLERAFGETADFSDISVAVYEFSDFEGPERTDDVPNPSILADFTLDYENTTVLTYGFNGGSWDRTAGSMKCNFSIPRESAVDYGKHCYLIVLGDDIENMEVRGYVTGDPTGECAELDWFRADVQRYETDLDTVLRECVSYIYGNNDFVYGDGLLVDFEIYYALFCDQLLSYGLLAGDGVVGRYDTGRLEEFYEVSGVNRVCYLQTEVTVPAGETVTVTASLRKPASFDYYCAHTENQGVYGYDAVTRLGSTLAFTRQTAELLDRGVIEIVRQNFGFDLAAGVTSVTLDPAAEHYYLEVRHLPESEE